MKYEKAINTAISHIANYGYYNGKSDIALEVIIAITNNTYQKPEFDSFKDSMTTLARFHKDTTIKNIINELIKSI